MDVQTKKWTEIAIRKILNTSAQGGRADFFMDLKEMMDHETCQHHLLSQKIKFASGPVSDTEFGVIFLDNKVAVVVIEDDDPDHAAAHLEFWSEDEFIGENKRWGEVCEEMYLDYVAKKVLLKDE